MGNEVGGNDPLEASEDPFERTASAPASTKGAEASKGLDDVFEESGADGTPAGVPKKKSSYEEFDDFEASGASVGSPKKVQTYGSEEFEKDEEDKTKAKEEEPVKDEPLE